MQGGKATIIVFYGIDGSGKTTLARLLACVLKEKKVNVYMVRLRAHHTLMYLLIRFLFWVKGLDYKLLQGKPIHLNYIVKQYLGGKRLYAILEIMSVLIWFMIEMLSRQILRRKHTIFIADRFIPDFIVMLHYTSKLDEHTLLKLAKFFEKLMLINPIYLHVYVDPRIAVSRKKGECLHPQFTMYLFAKYEWISKYLNHITIDTTNKKPFESIIQVLDHLKLLRVTRA
jgi:thymidylate kinase